MSRNFKQAPQYMAPQTGVAPPGAIPPPPDPMGGLAAAPKMDPRQMPGVMPPAAPPAPAAPMGVAPPTSAPPMGGHFGFSRPMIRR